MDRESMPFEDTPVRLDRRKSDESVAGLAKRMHIVEEWCHDMARQVNDLKRGQESQGVELEAQTALIEETHGKTVEMHEIFEATRNGFRMIGTVGNVGLRVIETGGKIAKPAAWIVALGVAVVAYYKTGNFALPPWTK